MTHTDAPQHLGTARAELTAAALLTGLDGLTIGTRLVMDDDDGWSGTSRLVLDAGLHADELVASLSFERDGAGRVTTLNLQLAGGLTVFCTGTLLTHQALAPLLALLERTPTR